MKAAIYTRISTNLKRQSHETQARDLRQFCEGRYLLTYEFRDDSTGTTNERPGLEAMLMGAHQRLFDVVVVWSLDRLSRTGIKGTLEILARLDAAGVNFVSYTEPHLCTSDPIQRNLIASIIATFGQLETIRIGERRAAGIARAKLEGTHCGRPRDPARTAAIALYNSGIMPPAIARQLDKNVSLIRRWIKESDPRSNMNRGGEPLAS